jgi:HEAT repeat protein
MASALEKALEKFRAVRVGPRGDGAVRELAALIQAPQIHALVLKPAAELVLAWEERSLLDALAKAIETLMGAEAIKRDPGCMGKTAAITTLVEMGSEHEALMLRGIRYKQVEPSHAKSIDTAANFRGLCGLGLVKMRYRAPVPLLIELLVDEEKDARVYAAMALGFWPGPESAAVLRLKALIGDESSEVIGEVLLALLRIDPREQLEFVEQFLEDSSSAIVEAAALALGQSHCAEALAKMIAAAQGHRGSAIGATLLMAIAMLRNEEAIAYLIGVVGSPETDRAIEALDALAMFKHDAKVVERIRAAMGNRRAVMKVFDEVFGR